jgi:hypothetical protein
MTKDTPIKIVPDTDPEEAIDAAVMKITEDKWSGSTDFDDTWGAHGRTSNDGDQEERAEVWFCLWCVVAWCDV